MADIFSKEKRSWVMSRIRSQTKLEALFLKKASKTFYAHGFRYRKNYGKAIGKPDIAFPRYKVAVFIDGDFWHGYNWVRLNKKIHGKFWKNKIRTNMKRDKSVTGKLRRQGWIVMRFWEHDIERNPEAAISKIEKRLVRARNG